MRPLSALAGRMVDAHPLELTAMPAPPILCNCAADCDYHRYDVWGEYDDDDSSLEGSGDGDDY